MLCKPLYLLRTHQHYDKIQASYMKRPLNVVVIFFTLSTWWATSCGVAERCKPNLVPPVAFREGAPGKVWRPSYYVYNNGRYQFVKGHYGTNYFRRFYLKRSVRGYSTKRKNGDRKSEKS